VVNWVTDNASLLTPNQTKAIDCLQQLFAPGVTEVEEMMKCGKNWLPDNGSVYGWYERRFVPVRSR
jgi:hypothetical protein